MHFHQLRKELSEIAEILRLRWTRGLERHGLLAAPAFPGRDRLAYEHLLATPVRAAPFVVLDTETTGFEPYGGDELVQIALIEYHGLTPTGRELSHLVRPGVPIPAQSRAIHGIGDERVANAPRAADLIDAIAAFIDGHVLIGHHVAFDMRFLDRVARRRYRRDFTNPRIDTVTLYQAVEAEVSSVALDAVAAACDVPVEDRHDARGDARTCGRIFARLAARLDDGEMTVGDLLERVHPIAGLSPEHPAQRLSQGQRHPAR